MGRLLNIIKAEYRLGRDMRELSRGADTVPYLYQHIVNGYKVINPYTYKLFTLCIFILIPKISIKIARIK